MNDIDILSQMYAAVCGSSDDALTLLEEGRVGEAKEVLRQGLETAEELYLNADR